MQPLNVTAAQPVNYALDPLAKSPFYRLVRDSPMIVTNMHRGAPLPAIDVLSRQRRWVQGNLVSAAICDPLLDLQQRAALLNFHGATLRDHLADRRGAKRRRFASNMEVMRNA